jgi:penicillin amidase
MKRRTTALAAIGGVLLLVLLTGVIFVWITTRRPHPEVTGTHSIEGLEAPVQVNRDANGVPHIYAESARDLYFAQGYVHAQDRFWQMEFWRRIGAGRLSALLGESAVSVDVFMRTMGFTEIAKAEYRSLPAPVRRHLEAYAQGVNAYIGPRSPGELSLELRLLELQGRDPQIEPWKPHHTLTWLKVMAWELGSNMQTELDTLELVRSVGLDLTRQFFGSYRYEEMPVVVTNEERRRSRERRGLSPLSTKQRAPNPVLGDLARPQSRLRALAGVPTRLSEGGITASVAPYRPLRSGYQPGSNAWVIGGSHTEDGSPLLANDPHLGIRMPSIWYEVHLHTKTDDSSEDEDALHVGGYSFVGAPGVIVGHNREISWGVTNVDPDVQDLFIERINPEDPTEYRVNGTWREMDLRSETIRIAGRHEPKEIVVRETRHGPIVTDLPGNESHRGFGIEQPRLSSEAMQLRALALQWTALEPNTTMTAVYRLNRAEDFGEFRDAVKRFDVPGQNFVYADDDGNIGYQASGQVPIRRNGSGRLPVPGWNDRYAWTGYVPFDELPFSYNPEKDYVVTANNPVTEPEYPHHIADHFDYGYRARRIDELIRTHEGPISRRDVAGMHGDLYARSAAEILPVVLRDAVFSRARSRILEAERDAASAAEQLETARETLSSWDRSMKTSSAGAALFGLLYQHLAEELFRDQFAESLWSRSGLLGSGSRMQNAIHALLERPESRYWDDATTLEVTETRDRILGRALVAALREGMRQFDETDIEEWEWGVLHTATFRNQSLGTSGISVVERIFNRGPVPVGGGLEQVTSAKWDLSDPYEVVHVSSMRQIIDMGEPGRSLMMHTTGQSGHPYHRHYADFIQPWRQVEYHRHRWSPEPPSWGDTLRLQPARTQ